MNGEFERISHGGKVLVNTTAMTAEREALRMGVEYLATLFPVDVKECTFVVENECTETKYIVDTPSIHSSVFATITQCAAIVRRTCIVLMRIVFAKKILQEKETINSLQQYNLVHRFIPMLLAMKIPEAIAAVDKEWENWRKFRRGT